MQKSYAKRKKQLKNRILRKRNRLAFLSQPFKKGVPKNLVDTTTSVEEQMLALSAQIHDLMVAYYKHIGKEMPTA